MCRAYSRLPQSLIISSEEERLMKKNRKHGSTTAASTVILPRSRDVLSMRDTPLRCCPGEGNIFMSLRRIPARFLSKPQCIPHKKDISALFPFINGFMPEWHYQYLNLLLMLILLPKELHITALHSAASIQASILKPALPPLSRMSDSMMSMALFVISSVSAK